MIVQIVYVTTYDGGFVEGVYDSEEKAVKVVEMFHKKEKRRKFPYSNGEHYTIESFEVE